MSLSKNSKFARLMSRLMRVAPFGGWRVLHQMLFLALLVPSLVPAARSQSLPSNSLPLPTDPPPEQDLTPRPQEPFPEPVPIPSLPPATDLLPPLEIEPEVEEAPQSNSAPTLCVQSFQVVNSTVFSETELAEVIETALRHEATVPAVGASADCPTGRQLTFPQILLARTAVTNLYLDNDYATSGAIIPADTPFVDGVVTIQAVEGRLEDIQVKGNRRLWTGYVTGRLGLAADPPLNTAKLLQGLQLLQLDPRIETIRADLQAGTTPGANLLVVEVVEADSFRLNLGLDNNRSPSVGSFRREISLQDNNLSGIGDTLVLGYVNTNGSDEINGRYRLPFGPYGTALTVAANLAENEVIEEPFDLLEIRSNSNSYNFTLEHPLVRTPTNQFDVALTLSRQFSQTALGIDDIGPFPLSAGADDEGRTVTSALRFAQTWTQRKTTQVIALRSQFSFGLGGFLDGTLNSDPDLPDNSFFAWQGQAQWVRRLGSNSLVLLRGSAQFAANDLLSAEQVGTGGQATVRGYRQDELLTDSAIQASAEARLPLLRIAQLDGTLQVAPFLDVGRAWNVNGINPDPRTLLGIGAGLIWQQPDVTARLDWGIPLISVSDEDESLQENGVYFSINYSFL